MPDQLNSAKPYGAYEPRGMIGRALRCTRRLRGTWLSLRLSYFLRALVVRRLKGRPLDVDVLGVKMRLFPFNNMCEKRMLFAPQTFDTVELGLLKTRVTEDFRFIDIGANVGGYALHVASLSGGAARILAIEPQPEIFDRLIFNIAQNPFGTVKAIACAVADKPGDLTLFLDPVNRGESSLKIVGSSQADAIRVPALPLMTLIEREKMTRIDAMKIDAEGSEDLILGPFFRDAGPGLYPKLLIIEDSHTLWQFDIPALLAEKGYREVLRTRLNLVYELDETVVSEA